MVLNARLDSTGRIEFMGANVPGWVCNLGLSLSSGTLSVVDAQGDSLSTNNPGWVTVPSSTSGQLAMLRVTSGGTINDDAHASSSLTGTGFGITETVDWGNDLPFFIYVANRNNTNIDGTDGNSVFFLARNPALTQTPSTAGNIGDNNTAPTTDDKNSIIIMANVTTTNYTSLPAQLIGAVRMQWSSTTTDWTIQTLGNSDGIGAAALRNTFNTIWTFPRGQNGAASNNYFSGGTPPSWATPANLLATYYLTPRGQVLYTLSTVLAGNVTNGATTTNLKIHVPVSPYLANSSLNYYTPAGLYTASGVTTATTTGSMLFNVNHDSNSGVIATYNFEIIENTDFTATSDDITLNVQYPAFNSIP